MNKPTHMYVGKKPCGCAVAVVCDMGDKYTANSVRDLILNGYTVERMEFGSPEHNECVSNLGCSCGSSNDEEDDDGPHLGVIIQEWLPGMGLQSRKVGEEG